MSARWKFWLARSSDLTLLGDLTPAHSKSLQVQLDRPGRFDFTIKGTQGVSQHISAIETCVLAYRNSTPIWSGPIFNIDDEYPDNSCQCSALGWYELLNHRLLMTGTQAPANMPTTDATTLTYNSVDQGQIAVDLINRTNAQWPTLIVPGTVDPSGTRNRTYNRYQNIGNEIQVLTSLDSGFDWTIDPVSRVFDVHFKTVKAGTTLFGYGQDRPNAVFGYRWGPSNLSKIGRTTDGTKTMNQEFALGQYGVAVVPDLADSPTDSIRRLGLFQEQQSLSEVPGAVNGSPIPQQPFLEAWAAAEVSIRQYPQQIFNIVPIPYTNLTKNVPQPFVDYGPGDIVYFSAKYGRLDIPIEKAGSPQPLRVFGVTVSPDEEGNERVTQIQGIMSTS